MRTLAFALAAIAPVFVLSADAQEAERYRLEKTEDGYVRMDTRTGEMSICEERNGGHLVCRTAADERSAFEDEIDRLNASLRALEDRVAALEKAPAASGLPTEEEFDKTMGYMERFFRGFMDIVKDFEKDETPPVSPQKT